MRGSRSRDGFDFGRSVREGAVGEIGGVFFWVLWELAVGAGKSTREGGVMIHRVKRNFIK